MATDTTVKLQPGADSTQHDQNLQQGVASTLSDAVGTQVTPAQLTPPAAQQPNVQEALPEDPKTEFDITEFIDSETGKRQVKTEPGRGWKGILLGRIRKQNPGKDIEPEK